MATHLSDELSVCTVPSKRPLRTRVWACTFASLLSVSTFPAQGEDTNQVLGDYFDGLRAWDLHEEATAAVIWLSAAQHGDRRAMEKVAALYAEGSVFPKDSALAYFWYSLAGARGSSSATSAAAVIRPQLNQTEVEAIDASVKGWRPASLPHTGRPPDLFAALNERDLDGFKSALQAHASAQAKDASGTPILFLAI